MSRKGDIERPLKVGELARRSGVSVRTLHWYDECGLLSPSRRSESGHRLYATADVARLQRIRSLRQLGLSLEQIGDCLQRRDFSPRRVIELHLVRLREQIVDAQRLCQRLERLADKLGERGAATSDDFLQVLEEMNMYDKYFTPEQMAQLAKRGQQVGDQRIREVEAEWPALLAEVRAAMARGDDPAGPHVQALAQRWMGLVREFSGGDPAIELGVARLYKGEQNVAGMETASMRELMGFIQLALKKGS